MVWFNSIALYVYCGACKNYWVEFPTIIKIVCYEWADSEYDKTTNKNVNKQMWTMNGTDDTENHKIRDVDADYSMLKRMSARKKWQYLNYYRWNHIL